MARLPDGVLALLRLKDREVGLSSEPARMLGELKFQVHLLWHVRIRWVLLNSRITSVAMEL